MVRGPDELVRGRGRPPLRPPRGCAVRQQLGDLGPFGGRGVFREAMEEGPVGVRLLSAAQEVVSQSVHLQSPKA